MTPIKDLPGSAGRAARPSGGLFRFWALGLQRLSANHFAPSRIPHRGHSAVKRVGETEWVSLKSVRLVGCRSSTPRARLGPLPEWPPSAPLLGEVRDLPLTCLSNSSPAVPLCL